MHIDLSAALRRPVGTPPPGRAVTANETRAAQSVATRALEVHLGVRAREAAYGPAGPFSAAALKAASGADPTPTAPPPGSQDSDVALDDPQPGESEDTVDAAADSAAPGSTSPAAASADRGVVSFGFVQSGRGSLLESRLVFVDEQGAEVPLMNWDNAGADFSAADWARVDPNRVSLVRGETVVVGQLQDVGDGSQAISFEGLVDSAGNRFSLSMQVNRGGDTANEPLPPAADDTPQAAAEPVVEDIAGPEAPEPQVLDSLAGLVGSLQDTLQRQQLQQLLAALPDDFAPAQDDFTETGDDVESEPSDDAPDEPLSPAPSPESRAALPGLWAAAEDGAPPARTLDLLA